MPVAMRFVLFVLSLIEIAIYKVLDSFVVTNKLDLSPIADLWFLCEVSTVDWVVLNEQVGLYIEKAHLEQFFDVFFHQKVTVFS